MPKSKRDDQLSKSDKYSVTLVWMNYWNHSPDHPCFWSSCVDGKSPSQDHASFQTFLTCSFSWPLFLWCHQTGVGWGASWGSSIPLDHIPNICASTLVIVIIESRFGITYISQLGEPIRHHSTKCDCPICVEIKWCQSIQFNICANAAQKKFSTVAGICEDISRDLNTYLS